MAHAAEGIGLRIADRMMTTDNLDAFRLHLRLRFMAAVLLPDALLDLIEPLLPASPPRLNGGRPRLQDRACLTGILFVLRSGIPWHMLPKELGCGSRMTCWRRLRDWQQEGIWDLMHFTLLSWLARDGDIDWSRAIVDSCR